jgi:hypothetical protein
LGTDKSNPLETVKLNFLDIIFGVIIGISFTDSKDLLIPFSFSFEAFTLLLVYFVVFTEWIMRHYLLIFLASIQVPRRTNIVLDLVSLYLLFYLVESVKNFSTVLAMFPVLLGFGLLEAIIPERQTYFGGFRYLPPRELFRYLSSNKRGLSHPIWNNLRDLSHTIWHSNLRDLFPDLCFLALFIIQFFLYHSLVNYYDGPVLAGASLCQWCTLITSFMLLILYLLPRLRGWPSTT